MVVTPVFKVRLEDMLNRKHLPPLGAFVNIHSLYYLTASAGLKDFEEWLLYVEQCPENLWVTKKSSPLALRLYFMQLFYPMAQRVHRKV
jgi:hypothetical protein